MRSIAAHSLSLSLVAAVAFAAGAGVAVYRGWGSPLVHVTALNESEQLVKSIIIEYETCGTKRTLTGTALRQGEQTRFSFPVCGEGGYKFYVQFGNGTNLVSSAYVENGYRVTEVVESTSIRSKTIPYGL